MLTMSHRSLAFGCIALLCSAFAVPVLAQAGGAATSDPFVATFADDGVTLTLSPTPKGYSGPIALAGEKIFPLTATPAKEGGQAGRGGQAGKAGQGGKPAPAANGSQP